jgi:hypothetical protein
MLQVDAEGIKSLTRHDLGCEPMRHRKPAKRYVFAVPPHLLDLVSPHCRISVLRGRRREPSWMPDQLLLNVTFSHDFVEANRAAELVLTTGNSPYLRSVDSRP